jgi:hypothetical protein
VSRAQPLTSLVTSLTWQKSHSNKRSTSALSSAALPSRSATNRRKRLVSSEGCCSLVRLELRSALPLFPFRVENLTDSTCRARGFSQVGLALKRLRESDHLLLFTFLTHRTRDTTTLCVLLSALALTLVRFSETVIRTTLEPWARFILLLRLTQG